MKREVKTNASELHRTVFELVTQCFPNEAIRQEESIRVDGKTLFIDIYLPKLKIAIECDGIQHFKYNAFFHTDAMSFANQKKNDASKKEYCRVNGITLVRVAYNEKMDKDSLKERILTQMREDNG